MIKVYDLIFEQDENEEVEPLDPQSKVDVGTKIRSSKKSLDTQIDSLFVKFEKESLVEGEEEDLSENFNFKKFLKEQDEDEEEGDLEEPEKDLDVDRFSASVFRLLSNYDNLLTIEEVILNRAAEFLNVNYDLGTVDRFYDIMETDYDVEMTGLPREGDDVEPPAKQGVGAYDAGTGGGA
jgi:hypothetical protein